MSFFKKAANAISNAASVVTSPAQESIQINKLELIINRRLERYDQEIKRISDNIDRIYSLEEVVQFEQELIDRCLREYDEEACPYMGRSCNPNWMEGGGDNLEIRKRILNRRLQERRGQLEVAIMEQTVKLAMAKKRSLTEK